MLPDPGDFAINGLQQVVSYPDLYSRRACHDLNIAYMGDGVNNNLKDLFCRLNLNLCVRFSGPSPADDQIAKGRVVVGPKGIANRFKSVVAIDGYSFWLSHHILYFLLSLFKPVGRRSVVGNN
jgi:hypothetical protein